MQELAFGTHGQSPQESCKPRAGNCSSPESSLEELSKVNEQAFQQQEAQVELDQEINTPSYVPRSQGAPCLHTVTLCNYQLFGALPVQNQAWVRLAHSQHWRGLKTL